MVAFVVTSCSDDNEPVPVTSYSEEVSAFSGAKMCADKAMKDFGYFANSRSSENAEIIKWYSNSSQSDLMAYIVNYEKGGFVLVNPDENANFPIFAISDEGQYMVGYNEDADNYIYQLYSLAGNDSTSMGGGPKPPIPNDSVLQSQAVVLENYEYLHKTQAWHQNSPFNRFCINRNNQLCVVGCVPLAIGELCAFYEFPEYVENQELDWININRSDRLEEMNESALFQIALLLRAAGEYSNTLYGSYETTTTLEGALEAWRALGYTNVRQISTNERLTDFVKEGPLQAFGKSATHTVGHCWVIDGCKYYYRKHEGEIDEEGNKIPDYEESNFYYHFNWGWGGYSNGYFLTGDSPYYYTMVDDFYQSLKVIVDFSH